MGAAAKAAAFPIVYGDRSYETFRTCAAYGYICILAKYGSKTV